MSRAGASMAVPIPRLRRVFSVLLPSLFVLGCVDTPSPLAPGIGGSVGLPHHGVLTAGAALPQQGPGYSRLRHDDIRWGTPRLVGAIVRAAAAVERARPGGAPLVLGDLSARHGGRIPQHRSHRSGRDADLLLYALATDGRPLRSHGFPRFGRDGLAMAERDTHTHVLLDVARTWLLVKALVSDEQATVQYLFVARWIEALVIEHARARGEPDPLVWRAATVLRQPGDSFPHDDHLHLRIACSAQEVVRGCVPSGPNRPWWPPPAQSEPESDESLLAMLLEDRGPAQ